MLCIRVETAASEPAAGVNGIAMPGEIANTGPDRDIESIRTVECQFLRIARSARDLGRGRSTACRFVREAEVLLHGRDRAVVGRSHRRRVKAARLGSQRASRWMET